MNEDFIDVWITLDKCLGQAQSWLDWILPGEKSHFPPDNFHRLILFVFFVEAEPKLLGAQSQASQQIAVMLMD